MEFTTALEQVMPSIQDVKRRLMRERGPSTPLAPSLVALREERVLCAAQAPALDAVLDVAPTLCIGLAPQLVVLAAEMTYPIEQNNPMTGEPWQTGEAQDAARTHDGVAQGWVRDGIAYTCMTRERKAAMYIQDVTVEGTEVTFADPVAAKPADTSLMDKLAAAMSYEPLDPSMVSRREGAPEPGPAKPEVNPGYVPAAQGRLTLDAGAANTLHKKLAEADGNLVYIAASNEQAMKLMASGMPQDLLLT